MTVNLSPLAGAGQQFLDDSGNVLTGGKLYSYAAGTTTPQTTYISASGLTAHSNPIILNAAGRVATGEIWLTAGSNYKFVLYTSTDVLIASWDNITGIATNANNVEYDPPFIGAVTSGYTVSDKLEQIISVKDFGAVGDGVTDDSAAMNAASLAAAGKRLYIPAGTYAIKNFLIASDTTVVCDSNTVFIPSDTVTVTSSNACIWLTGDNINWQGGKVLGQVSTTFGSLPAPYYGMRIQQTTGDSHPYKITIRDFEVEGCIQAIWAVSSDEMTVDNVTIRSAYQWGLAFPAPRTKRLIVNNFRAYNTGINEGLKIASLFNVSGDASADIILTNLDIQNCGRLDPSSATWQNGIDCFISAAQNLQISNFNIVNCGGGGIEIKRNDAVNISPNEYKNVIISNGRVSTDVVDATCVSLNISAPTPTTANTARNVMIANVQFEYTGLAAPASAYGIISNAYTNVQISNCQFIGDFSSAINPSAFAAFDDAIRNWVISGCSVFGAQNGFFFGNGVIDDVSLIGNVFNCTEHCVVISASATGGSKFVVQGGVYRSSGASFYPVYIADNITEVSISNANLIAVASAVRANAGGGVIQNCNLVSATDAFRMEGGTWEYTNNKLSIPTTDRAYTLSAGTIYSYRNSRGSSSTLPALDSTVGEIVYNNTPVAGGTIGWICTTAGTTSTSVWKTYGAIQA